MKLKDKLIILSDKLDRLGLQKDADIIDLLLKKVATSGAADLLDDEDLSDDEKTGKS